MPISVPDKYRAHLDRFVPDWERRLADFRKARKLWRIKGTNEAIKLALLAVCTWFATLVFLHFANTLWFIYLHTPMGEKFAAEVSVRLAPAISALLNRNLFHLSLLATGNSLTTCLMAGALGQMLAIQRFTYVGRGLLNRLGWALTCAALVPLNPWTVDPGAGQPLASLYLHLIPCAFLLSGTFSLTHHLLPEMNFLALGRQLFDYAEFVRLRNRLPQNETLEDQDRNGGAT